jgi:hypothetical protein
MKAWILSFIYASLATCVGGDMESIGSIVRLGNDAKGAYISTNRTSTPFYLVGEIKLPSMVGTKQDTNVLSSSRMALITQYVPALALTKDKVATTGYIRVSGRYAVLTGRSLTLTDFVMKVSDDEESRNEVLAVHFDSLTFQVAVAFAEDVEKSAPKKR